MSIRRPVVYTANYKLWNHVLELGHVYIDARPNMGRPEWAIPWSYLNLAKDQGMSSERIMDMYAQYLNESMIKNPGIWRQLKTMKSMVVADTEPHDSVMAYRMVLRTAIMNYLIDEGVNPIHGGEIFKNDHKHYDNLMAVMAE